MPAAALAAPAPSHSQDIESLESQYLATNDPEQHKQLVSALKTLARNCSPEDAGALNEAVSTMLPATDSTWEAGELLAIGAANPAVQPAAAPSVADDAGFLVDPRHAPEEARNPNGDVETLADIRIDRLQKDSQGHDGLASAHGAAGLADQQRGRRQDLFAALRDVLRDERDAERGAGASAEEQWPRGGSIGFRRPAGGGAGRVDVLRLPARASCAFPHLQPGDVVEIEYRCCRRPG